MTPTNISNGQLLHWDNEIEKMNGSILTHFLKSKVTEFYRYNGIRIKTLKDKIHELQGRYFVIENNNIKHEGEGKDAKPIMIEGKTLEDYRKAYSELMQQIVSIQL